MQIKELKSVLKYNTWIELWCSDLNYPVATIQFCFLEKLELNPLFFDFYYNEKKKCIILKIDLMENYKNLKNILKRSGLYETAMLYN